MSNRMELHTKPAADGMSCTIELHKNGDPIGHIIFDATDVEGFARHLGNVRSKMKDEVPRELEPNSRIQAIVDPIWQIVMDDLEGHRQLILRHPGLGWLGFAIPCHEAQHIAKCLAATLDEASGESGPG